MSHDISACAFKKGSAWSQIRSDTLTDARHGPTLHVKISLNDTGTGCIRFSHACYAGPWTANCSKKTPFVLANRSRADEIRTRFKSEYGFRQLVLPLPETSSMKRVNRGETPNNGGRNTVNLAGLSEEIVRL